MSHIEKEINEILGTEDIYSYKNLDFSKQEMKKVQSILDYCK